MWTIKQWYDEARAAAVADPAKVRVWADFILSRYRDLDPQLSDAALLDWLSSANRQRLAAVPDFARYPELRGMPELIDAKWRGTRDGAGLTDLQWAAHCNDLYCYRQRIQAPKKQDADKKRPWDGPGCTYVYFPTSDRGPILANNLDTTLDQPFGQPEWIALNEHLIMGGVSCGIFYDEPSPETFPAPVFLLVSRYCRSTDEAVEMLTRYNHFWGPCNMLVIDRNQQVAMVEKSACRIGVRRSPDGFAFITAMTMAEPGMKAYLHDRRAFSLKERGLAADCLDTKYWAEADHRYDLLTELLDEARRQPTVEKLRQIIQFRDDRRGRVCYDGERLEPGAPPAEYTLRTTLWHLRDGTATWWGRQGDTPSFQAKPKTVTYPDVWRW